MKEGGNALVVGEGVNLGRFWEVVWKRRRN